MTLAEILNGPHCVVYEVDGPRVRFKLESEPLAIWIWKRFTDAGFAYSGQLHGWHRFAFLAEGEMPVLE